MGNRSQFRGMVAAGRMTLVALVGVIVLSLTAGSAVAGEKTARDAQFRTLSGKTLQLSEFRGKPVLLSFWSTSCAICIQEMPQMKLLYHTLKDAGADMISITMPYDPPNHVVEAATDLELPFPVAIDLTGELMKLFDIRGTPMKILISPEGYTAQTFLGPLDYAKTLGAITDLIPK